MLKNRPGFCGWLGLVTYVIVVDSLLIKYHKKTLSEVMGDALLHPAKRIPLLTLWVILTLHLFGTLMPDKLRGFLGHYDPIGLAARKLEILFDNGNND